MITTESAKSRPIDPKLLEVLACPITKTTLIFDRDSQELMSRAAGLAFPIREGIPILLVEEARSLTDAEREASVRPAYRRVDKPTE